MTQGKSQRRWLRILGFVVGSLLVASAIGLWVYWYALFPPAPAWVNAVFTILAALGGLILFAATVLSGVAALRDLRKGKEVSGHARREFPFEVIRDPGDVLPALFGTSPNSLADGRLTYRARQADRDITQELRDALGAHRCVLMTSVSGVGKTREIAELAHNLVDEGYSLLLFDKHDQLAEPVRFPEDLRDTRNLLFVFDDVHLACAGPQEATSPRGTFHDRLLAFVEQARAQFGRREVNVLAAARTEEEHRRHLQRRRHPLWQLFDEYKLPVPHPEAQTEFLLEAAETMGVTIPGEDVPRIVGANDRTFRNLLQNVREARRRRELTAATFLPHREQAFDKPYTELRRSHPSLVPPLWPAPVGQITSAWIALPDNTSSPARARRRPWLRRASC
jgi:hypothetical protein